MWQKWIRIDGSRFLAIWLVNFKSYFLHHLQDAHHLKLSSYFVIADGQKYLEIVKKLETKRPISWAAYRRGKLERVFFI